MVNKANGWNRVSIRFAIFRPIKASSVNRHELPVKHLAHWHFGVLIKSRRRSKTSLRIINAQISRGICRVELLFEQSIVNTYWTWRTHWLSRRKYIPRQYRLTRNIQFKEKLRLHFFVLKNLYYTVWFYTKQCEIRNQSNYEYVNTEQHNFFSHCAHLPSAVDRLYLWVCCCCLGGLVKFFLLLCLHIRLQSAFTSLNHSSVTECTLASVHRLKMLFSFQNPSLDNATLSLSFTTPTININRK